MKYFPDKYTFVARWQPFFLVLWPAVSSAFALIPGDLIGWKGVFGLLVTVGLPQVSGQLARDAGKSKEKELFKRWGGNPTVTQLRYRDAPNRVILRTRHEKLERLTGISAPTQEEELDKPEEADDIYEAYATALKTKTRQEIYGQLVFEENCNYGFRRNLFGLKPFGLLASALAVTINVVQLTVDWRVDTSISPWVVAVFLSNLLLLGFWCWVVKPNWVKTVAECYSDRLLELTDTI